MKHIWRRLRRFLRPPRRLSFTREGRWFCGICLGIGIAAINTGNNLLYLVLGMMLSFIVASGVLSEVALRGLSVERLPATRPHAGRPFLMGILLRNQKRRFASFSLEIQDITSDGPLDKKCYFLKVPPGRHQSAYYRHSFARRGRYQLRGFRVATRFPFALFRKSRDIDAPAEVIVFPALREVTRAAALRSGHGGDRPRPISGRSGDPFGLREYRAGDPPRDIHWRKSAQLGAPIVRQLEREESSSVILLLDNSLPSAPSNHDRAALEHAISTAASLAADHIARGHLVRLVTRTQSLASGGGHSHLLRILTCLALLESVSTDAGDTAWSAAAIQTDPGELIAISSAGNCSPDGTPRLFRAGSAVGGGSSELRSDE